MRNEIALSVIDQIIDLSDRLRKRVDKEKIGDAVRLFLSVVFADSQVTAAMRAEELYKCVLLKGYPPQEIVLEVVRGAGLQSNSLFARSLDRHVRYYWRRFFSRGGFLSLRISALTGAFGHQDVHPEDALFHLSLQAELGECSNCSAYPIASGMQIFGWVLTNDDDVNSEPTGWPDVKEYPGVLQTQVRRFRQDLWARDEKAPRTVIVLEAGLKEARSLYLSDPLNFGGPRTVQDLVATAHSWREQIATFEKQVIADKQEDRLVNAPAVISWPNDKANQGLIVLIQTLANNIEHDRRDELCQQAVKEIWLPDDWKKDDVGEVLWEACTEVLGWTAATSLRRSRDGEWKWIKREWGIKLFDRSIGAIAKSEYSFEKTVVRAAELVADANEAKLHRISGGYLQGWANGLVIPTAVFYKNVLREYTPPGMIVLISEHPIEWIDSASKAVMAQLSRIVAKMEPAVKEPEVIQLAVEIPDVIELHGSNWYCADMPCVPETPYADSIGKLDRAIESWQGGQDKDVVLVGGYSRAGKTFALKKVLEKHGYEYEPFFCIADDLTRRKNEILLRIQDSQAKKKALFIDDFPSGGDKSKVHELLPLIEKERAVLSGVDLSNCLICITYSEELLPDVVNRSRDDYKISIPELRYHRQDIPLMIALFLSKIGCETISRAAMLGLLSHNWEKVVDIKSFFLDKLQKSIKIEGKSSLLHADLPEEFRVAHWPALDRRYHTVR